jgi:radical SAM superfamily enzyme YgiQ (UPF0313 family)
MGLKVKCNFIFGLPGEMPETLAETIDFACKIGLSYFQQNFFTVWPGCEAAKEASSHGETVSDWRRLAHQRVTFVPHGVTREQLMRASRRVFRRFYLRPRIVLELLYSIRSMRTLKSLLVSFGVFLKTVSRRSLG